MMNIKDFEIKNDFVKGSITTVGGAFTGFSLVQLIVHPELWTFFLPMLGLGIAMIVAFWAFSARHVYRRRDESIAAHAQYLRDRHR